jgi:signal transduction histidine kinase
MNLKFHLLVRIILAAICYLLITAAYVLYQADRQAKDEAQVTLDSIGKQLEIQLFRMDMGLKHAIKFPDFTLWKENQSATGVCIRFIPPNNDVAQGICRGAEWSDKSWPALFETAYRLIFSPGLELFRQTTYKDQVHGVISVTPSVERELSHAWGNMLVLLELSVLTIAAVCLLVYISISRALRPAQIIVSGLSKMQKGELSFRLPNFDLLEWQATSSAINELAASQQQLISKRKQLASKLITLQDEERRFLARELHDELGQCLAAINALAASIAQTAEQDCPQITEEAKNISRINQRMMNTVQTILVRLRPADIDELGLELSLNSLITEWNTRASSKIHFQLLINGDCQQLKQPLPITLFRIVQECLTNISKHSSAKTATVDLNISDKLITLTINDDGDIDTLPFAANSGFGLLGIRERVCPLRGEFTIEKSKSGGLSIKVTLPLNCTEDVKHGD